MIEIRKTDVFAEWLDNLRDIRARARILVRIERLAAGNPGHVEPVAEGVSELIFLLAGGDKSTQAKDIKLALRLARNL